MGAPAVPLIDIVSYQVRQEYTGTNLDSELVEAEVSAHIRLMNAISENQNIAQALQQFRVSAKAILSATNSGSTETSKIDDLAKSKAQQYEVVYALPSLTSYLYHDTAHDYEKLSIPVLGLFGGKDLQVTIAQNKDIMERALLKSKTSYHFEIFTDANHYFQKAKTGQRQEYATLDKRFVDGFVEKIANWILDN
ncbi:hypothetical protein PA25_18230 [Pseudoalteromonas sp. A25]|uniref:dienelactone hydrolase family protein n=1 Tax=Pseudoalteromonas sp. A25 TaxID=116092 RepID=UPI00126053A5|nr:dienelactone hydrolase family protein [Pseudoalteromonas sp. A25]BBN81838.1 hypothetical protein PA25_18230 [Pseudoalteromonas sp. A25]